MFENIFEHCHMENSVFVQGMFWIALLSVTYAGTLYYKYRESRDAEQAKIDEVEKQ